MRLSNMQSGCFVLRVDSNTDALDNIAVAAALLAGKNMVLTVDNNQAAKSNSANNKRVSNQGDWRLQSKVFLEGMGVVTEEEGGDQSSKRNILIVERAMRVGARILF